ncbi:uncharacterized protein LOC111642414 [Centruroides sculpturatus]|uniref:uncharacterized protein LOC111642414 n=1 Tax=Centruroides sculpturatus TaxID=218467 RepID=UPI000C6D397F|nr:uncharacterized protein LOC111642414 [Centruroides sculpturatus]
MAESDAVSSPVGCEESDLDELVGCLIYLATVSHPDIAFAVNKAARVIEKPTVQNWNQVKCIFWYLKDMNWGIIYNKEEKLKVYNNADFAGDKKNKMFNNWNHCKVLRWNYIMD